MSFGGLLGQLKFKLLNFSQMSRNKKTVVYVWEKVQYGFDSQRDCLLPQNRSVVELLGQRIDLKINRLIH